MGDEGQRNMVAKAGAKGSAGCCTECCGCISSALVKLTAGIISVFGLALIGYGLFLGIKHAWGGIAYFMLGAGGYASLCGLLGLYLSCTKAPSCSTRLYSTLLILASLVELAVAIALKADKSWTEKFFSEHCGGGDDCDKDTKWIDDHTNGVFFFLLIAAGVQFVAALLACCYLSTHQELDEDEFD